MPSEKEFDELLATPSEQVLELLGRQVYQPPLGALPPRVSEYISAARLWLDSHRKEICCLCRENAKLRAYMEGKETYKATQIAAIVFDLICLTVKLPVAGAASASVTLVQLGLDRFCADCSVADVQR